MKRRDSMGNAVGLYFVDTLEGTAVFGGLAGGHRTIFFASQMCYITVVQ